MTLQQIKYALVIAEAGSLNKAAEILYISQPSLSSSIKELEGDTGITIFTRNSRGVIPTPEGEEFLSYARQVYQQYELLTDKYSGKAKRKHRFGVSSQHYSFAVDAFVKTVELYDTIGFDFAFRETRTMDVIEDVGSAKSEIGIIFKSDYNEKIIDKMLKVNDLEFTSLIRCRAYVYIHKDHPLADHESIAFDELLDYPCLMFEQGDSIPGFFAEEILSDKEYPRVIRTTDRATNLNFMIGLNGFTLCSGIVSEELNGSDYRMIPFREDDENRNTIMNIGYITKKKTIRSDIAGDYIFFIKEFLDKVKDPVLNKD
ncbi:MAG: LysR family transcriptional regulator [Oscillospiraceae bacterium]|nr:LysR family transcriptional regulator [Oscillospiraceae bacterium]MBR4347087.1 LysR family transcriptional regulator [Oscillospiraceae bacterium]